MKANEVDEVIDANNKMIIKLLSEERLTKDVKKEIAHLLAKNNVMIVRNCQ